MLMIVSPPKALASLDSLFHLAIVPSHCVHCYLSSAAARHLASLWKVPPCVLYVSSRHFCLFKPFSAHETIFGLVLKGNDFVVESVWNLDVKCEVQMCLCTFAGDEKKNQTILSSTVFTIAKYMMLLE